MGTLNRTERWIENVKEIIRGTVAVDSTTRARLLSTAPMVALAFEASAFLDKIHAYVAAREAVTRFGGEFFRKVYVAQLQDLDAVLQKCSAEVQLGVLSEIRSYGHLIEDPGLLLKRLPKVARLPPALLDDAETAILRRGAQLLTEVDDPKIATELRGYWAHYLSVVPPSEESEWKEIVTTIRQAAEKFGNGRLTDFYADELADHAARVSPLELASTLRRSGSSYKGHLSRIVGQLFQSYALRSPEVLELFEVARLTAARKAARLGGGLWQPIQTGSKLELIALDSAEAAAASKAGKSYFEKLLWPLFADDSVAAARLPKTEGIGDIDFSALFQAKAERGDTALLDQNVNDLLRLWDDTTGRTVFARFEQSNGKGGTNRFICQVRQSDPTQRDPLTFYRIATSNTDIPDSALLARLGITQKSINLWPSRDLLQDIADIFFSAATE